MYDVAVKAPDLLDGNLLLVFDIGGTTVRAGLYDAMHDRLVADTAVDAAGARGTGDGAAQLVRLLDELKRLLSPSNKLTGAVVGFPGPVSPEGLVLAAPTLWPGKAFEPLALGAELEAIWDGIPVVVLNDMTAVGNAYVTTDRRDFCVVTMSSGIGHKVVLDGRVVVGPTGMGGEIGHVVVRHRGVPVACDCGGFDHLGAIASGRGILRFARTQAASAPREFARSQLGQSTNSEPGRITNELIAQHYRGGDPWTSETVRAGIEPLGWILAVIRSAIGVDDFLIVGGFADALGPRVCSDLATAASAASWDVEANWTELIAPGSLGSRAGLLGGGRLGAAKLRML